MAKAKKKSEPEVLEETTASMDEMAGAEDGAPQSLAEEVWDSVDENGDPTQVGFDVASRVSIHGLAQLQGVATIHSESLVAEDVVLVHTVFNQVAEIAKAGIELAKAAALNLAGKDGGKTETELGTVNVSVVKASTQDVYTEATVELLEANDLLETGCSLSAEMREGINVANITEAEMEVLEKYFEVELVPDAAKIDGLIALGQLTASDVQDTIETEELRKGHSRVAIKPTEELVTFFE